MRYQLHDIPYAQFEQIGLNKQAVQKTLNGEDIERLMNGEKTNLKSIPLSIGGKKLEIDTKFSLRRNADNSVSLMLHPVRPEISPVYQFSENEKKQLEMGNTVLKMDDKQNQTLYQMDRDTKEIMRISKDKIQIPDFIEDIQLSQAQKEKLRHGETIELEKQDKKLNVKLDLSKPQLYKINVSNSMKINNTPQYKR